MIRETLRGTSTTLTFLSDHLVVIHLVITLLVILLKQLEHLLLIELSFNRCHLNEESLSKLLLQEEWGSTTL